MSADILIRNARPMGGEPVDLVVRNGRFSASGGDRPAQEIDASGHIALPGLVEAHTHLDKTLIGMSWFENRVGPTRSDRILADRKAKRELGIDARRQSARQIMQTLSYGVLSIRSHVDVDTEHGLWGVEGVMATRDGYRDIVDIELVAFPQSGLLRRPGTLELMDQAMKAGCEIVGGLDPCGIDRDPKGHLDAVFGLCQKYGKPLDIHLHEPGEMGAFSTELIIERTRALGMHGKVTISHAFCLGSPDMALVDPLIGELAALDIAIMTTAPSRSAAPPVRKLVDAGVRVCSGSDGIRDTWGPYGNADMIERAMFVGLRNNFRRDDELKIALDVCTQGGAQVMEIADYGLAEGKAADPVDHAENMERAGEDEVVHHPVDRWTNPCSGAGSSVSGCRICARSPAKASKG